MSGVITAEGFVLRTEGLTREQHDRLIELRNKVLDMWVTANLPGTKSVDTDGYLVQVRRLRETAENQYDSNAWRAALLSLKTYAEVKVDEFRRRRYLRSYGTEIEENDEGDLDDEDDDDRGPMTKRINLEDPN